MTLEYVRASSGSNRPNLIECPACGADLRGQTDTGDHIAEHGPEDFGLGDGKRLITDGGADVYLTGNTNNGELPTEKDSEFTCPRCHSRCTESPIDGTEYGHRRECPRRPEIDRYVNGPPYDPQEDPHATPDESAIADGGDRRVD